MSLILIEEINGEKMVSSFTVAAELGVEHRATVQTIEKYLSEIEASFGLVTFEMVPDSLGRMNTPQKVAYLTEDQAIFVSTLSRNSQQVVQFKARLVQAFQAARKFIQQVTAPLSDAEMRLHVFKQLEQEAESLKVQNQLLETTIKQQAPLVEYAGKVLNANSLITSTVVAADFGKTANWLHLELKKLHIMWKVGGTWVLTSRYADKGYTQTKTHPYTDTLGQPQTSIQTYWTEKGRAFIHSKLNESKAVA